MTTKLVIYNGDTTSYRCCSSPIHLKKGNSYEVIDEDVMDIQTNYTLKEVPGSYNSSWFDEVKPTYLSISNEIPVEGKCLENFVRINNMTGTLQRVKISAVIFNVHLIGMNTYEVRTKPSTYIVQVIEQKKEIT